MKDIRGIVLGALLGALLMLTASLANAAPAIREFQSDSLPQIVSSQKGKPFVLVVWSLDCPYCQASMGTLSQEARKRKDLQVVTLTTDTLGDAQTSALVRKRLKAAGLTSNAWAFGPVAPEQLRFAIDAGWHGEMPRSYWFNARGERVAHSGVITAAIVNKMLAE